MRPMTKAWTAVLFLFVTCMILVVSVHQLHKSILLSTLATLVSVSLCAAIGERLFRYFHDGSGQDAD